MGGRLGRRIGWAILAVDVAVLAPAATLLVVNRPLEPSGLLLAGAPALIGLTYPLLGIIVANRLPRNPIGWILIVLGLMISVSLLADEYALRGQLGAPGSLPGSGFAAWLQFWLLGSFFAAGLPLLFLLFPTGKLPSARWRPVLYGVGLLFVVQNALAMFPRQPMTTVFEGTNLHLSNPTGLYDPDTLNSGPLQVLGIAILLVFAVVILACGGALVVRLRHARGVERQQVKWLAYVASLLVVGLALDLAAQATGQTTLRQAAHEFAVLTAILGVPLATVTALLRYHLYGIDLVISRTVLVAGMATFITVVYLAIVIGLGSLIGLGGKPNLALSLIAATLIAIAFQPVRARLRDAANLIAYGHRASPLEVLAEFSKEISASKDDAETLPHVARVLAQGVSASRAEVWLRVDAQLIRAAAWPGEIASAPQQTTVPVVGLPSIPGADHVVLVEHQNEVLGALALKMPAGEGLYPVEARLLTDLAVHMAVVLRNLGLSAALRARLTDISLQEVELRRSRTEVVKAQDVERRRLERNIHDGAQQHIVALAMKVKVAANLASSAPQRASLLAAELRVDTGEALALVKKLSSGAQPVVLQEEGLVAALWTHARQLEGVTIDDRLTSRPDPEVETAVYFTCVEALQNATKHAPGAHVVILLESNHDELQFSVTDDGAGFDSKLAAAGSGLRNMRERVVALAGELTVGAGPRGGTVVTGRIPLAAVVLG